MPLNDIKFIESSFGGGWVVAITHEGSQYMEEFYDEEPREIAPLGGEVGWIVEPQDVRQLVESARVDGVHILR